VSKVGMETVARPIAERTPARAPLLDINAVAEALCVTPRHVRRLVAERRIPFFKVGRFVRFDPADLDIWLGQQRVEIHSCTVGRRTTGR